MTDRDTQPVRAPTGGKYGARKKLEGMQRANPLPDNTGTPGGEGAPQPQPVQRPDVFGPTGRPQEPVTQGAGSGGFGALPDDPVEFLRAVYLRHPSPGVRRLLERAAKQRPREATNAGGQMQQRQVPDRQRPMRVQDEGGGGQVVPGVPGQEPQMRPQ